MVRSDYSEQLANHKLVKLKPSVCRLRFYDTIYQEPLNQLTDVRANPQILNEALSYEARMDVLDQLFVEGMVKAIRQINEERRNGYRNGTTD